MAKANKDGWIRHRSNKCPVEDSCIVEARDSEGLHYGPCRADDIAWERDGCHEKITSYRVYKPEQQKEAEVKETAETLRARYLATFEEKKALEATIAARQNEIAMIAKEREELRGKVRALGFDFYDAPKEIGENLPAEEWRIGDFVEATHSSSCGGFNKGNVYAISELSWRSPDDLVVCVQIDENGSTQNGWGHTNFKFHSRPK